MKDQTSVITLSLCLVPCTQLAVSEVINENRHATPSYLRRVLEVASAVRSADPSGLACLQCASTSFAHESVGTHVFGNDRGNVDVLSFQTYPSISPGSTSRRGNTTVCLPCYSVRMESIARSATKCSQRGTSGLLTLFLSRPRPRLHVRTWSV